MEVVVVAIISGVLGGIPSVIATIMSNNKSTALMEYKIDKLDEKVHQHNNLIDRMYKVEQDVAILKEEVKNWQIQITNI